VANFGYQARSIISGVSTRPYALREDGHMSDASENCMLSTRFGLTKRPGSTFLQTVEASNAANYGVFIPLHVGDAEKIVVGLGAGYWQIFSGSGGKEPVCHYPSSQGSTATAAAKYASAGASFAPQYTSTTTIGDVTFIADSQVTPKMLDSATAALDEDGRTSTWPGYTFPGASIEDPDDSGTIGTDITNDDIFVWWVKSVVYTSGYERLHHITWQEDINGTTTTYKKTVISKKSSSATSSRRLDNDTSVSDHHGCWPDGQTVAACGSYKLSSKQNAVGHNMIQATSLDSQSYGSAEDDIDMNGVDCVMAMYINKDRGSLSSVSQTGSDGEDSKVLAWKNVDVIADLPPNSFLDHTLKVGSSDIDGGSYFRFVSDDTVIKEFSNNAGATNYDNANGQVNATSKIPRTGHWEEYCGAGVAQSINGSTMPLLLVRRPDNSFGLMEARGAFYVNGDEEEVVMDDDNTVQITFDAGFSDDGSSTALAPIVVGDTIQFKEKSGGLSALATNLEFDTTYYIKTVESRVSAKVWKVTLSSTSKTGAVVDIDSDVTGDVYVQLTTYEDFDWAKREAGDDNTNPLPGFIDQSITSLFSFQDRLGFVSEGSVIFSGTGDYFNFFKTTVRDLIDSDPFTAAPNLTDGDSLKFAIPFERDLVLISNKAQFTLKATEGLSPTTIAIVQSANVNNDIYAMPTVVGDNLFLSYSQEDTSGVTALKKSARVADQYDVIDTSLNTPGYLPRSPRRMAGSSKYNMLFYLDDGSPTSTDNTDLYVYSWMDTSEGRPHSAWMKWTFGTDYQIHDIMMFGDRLYMLTDTNNMLCLEYIDLDLTSEDNMLQGGDSSATNDLRTNFGTVLIDHKAANFVNATQTSEVIGDRDGADLSIGGVFARTNATENSTIDLKYKLLASNDENIVIVMADDTGTIYEYALSGTTTGTITVELASDGSLAGHGADEGTPAAQATTRLTLHGVNLSGKEFYVGLKYTMNATYGPFIPSTQEGSLSGRNIFAKSGRLTYSMANEFSIDVIQDATYTQTISAADSKSTKTGDVMFAIRKHLPDLAFTVKNEKPWNAMFQILKYDFAVQEIAGG